MHRFVFILSLMASFSLLAYAGANISFEETEYDLRQVELGSGVVSHSYVFRNVGDKPLVIKDVRSSCGCTYASWTASPVAPGDTGSVCVFYKNNVSGSFHKTVKVISNSSRSTHKLPLVLKGESVKTQK